MSKNYSEEELLHLSGIQHFAFCPRQWALIHIEQLWLENILTFEGRSIHEKADDPFFSEMRDDIIITRSMPIASLEIGLYGIADVVEFHQSEKGISLKGRSGFWKPYPIEYKYGKPKPDDRDIVQLCAQGMCLEEMLNTPVRSGDMFYGRTRRRQKVEFDEKLRNRVKQLSYEMHCLFDEGVTPKPNYTSACKNCSLLNLCLPHIGDRRSVKRYFEDALREVK